ncbi:hypothetical protein SMACR_09345 [Sordaria macrospora]|uniref:Ecp2 effector protein domain-containing protein n=1 Tax=Sordaria macrospora TaxID=5147 RepID=A0A8S8ZJM9_SORMA|nr:hypothetical protein SMACR_09345 [Sordaria macrospora]WPJ65061.1 hypothetical protein SMAC4_09345 [Sordaria macrospora]
MSFFKVLLSLACVALLHSEALAMVASRMDLQTRDDMPTFALISMTCTSSLAGYWAPRDGAYGAIAYLETKAGTPDIPASTAPIQCVDVACHQTAGFVQGAAIVFCNDPTDKNLPSYKWIADGARRIVESEECKKDLVKNGINDTWVAGETMYENGWHVAVRASYCVGV